MKGREGEGREGRERKKRREREESRGEGREMGRSTEITIGQQYTISKLNNSP